MHVRTSDTTSSLQPLKLRYGLFAQSVSPRVFTHAYSTETHTWDLAEQDAEDTNLRSSIGQMLISYYELCPLALFLTA